MGLKEDDNKSRKKEKPVKGKGGEDEGILRE